VANLLEGRHKRANVSLFPGSIFLASDGFRVNHESEQLSLFSLGTKQMLRSLGDLRQYYRDSDRASDTPNETFWQERSDYLGNRDPT
jgi:hypothetical protein